MSLTFMRPPRRLHEAGIGAWSTEDNVISDPEESASERK